MRILNVFDNKDYTENDVVLERKAARAIIIKNKKLYLVHGRYSKDYKFPGGGIEGNETIIETLIREVREETGLIVKEDTIKEYGKVIERRKSIKPNENFIFHMESYYYFCECEDTILEITPTKSEIVAGYRPELVNIDKAISLNKKNKSPWIMRELFVLELLKREFSNLL